MIEINESNFNEIIGGGKPVVIDFWAPWCGPCRALSPVVEAIAQEYEAKVAVCKCNIDQNREIGMNYMVRSIPTLVFIKDGQAVDKLVGMCDKSKIVAKIETML